MPKGESLKGKGQGITFLKAHLENDGKECLIWPYTRNGHGYGMMSYLGKMGEAHRFMCLLVHGKPPSPRHQAAHDCGNGHKGCVHPKHIFWKTPRRNRLDSNDHGTGNRPAPRRLTIDQVMEIRASSKPYAELAAEYGVHRDTIGKIFRGETWKEPRSKLTSAQIQKIKELSGTAMLTSHIAVLVGANYHAVRKMRLAKTFRGQ